MRIAALVIGILTVVRIHAVVAGSQGFYGHAFVPSAQTLPEGGGVYSYHWLVTEEIPRPQWNVLNQQHHSLVATPLPWMEMGASAHRTTYTDTSLVNWQGSLAGKIILPKAFPYMPSLALGSYDLIRNGRFLQHIYFVGGVDWQAFDGGLSLDLGAVYHRRRNSANPYSSPAVTSFLAMEANYGKVSLSLQNFWRETRWGVAPSVSLRPFASGPGFTWLEMSAGAAWRAPSAEKGISGWGSVQIGLPENRNRNDSGATYFWLDLNPVLDYSLGSDEHSVRPVLEVEGVGALWIPGLYMVHALAFQAHTADKERLVPRDLWDRSYLLYRGDASRGFHTGALHIAQPVLAGGLLNTGILGIQLWENLTLPGFVPAVLQAGWSWGNAESWNATLEMPLHPIPSGWLSLSQFYGEGGYYVGNHPGYRLAFRQGSEQRYLRLAVGYDHDDRSVLAELALRFRFQESPALKGHGMALRMAPNAEHRSDVPLYIYKYNAPVYVEGNSPRRLHGVPWGP